MNEEQDTFLRLQYDYEFVQALTSPDYVKYLFSRKYFEDPAFLNYLEYLKYWQQPEYIKYLKKPTCLKVLEALLLEEVRKEVYENDKFLDVLITR
eukprot:CAMPEP_0202961344 /NCGR_PEP_ID=MMETSP1396-20130829/5392_1 /ASSEMBLY_ACC=CAM_ASM_000872 /TAXON_ID= /ORGANISM="Pseudokeronopsis sp., Strain Brazil" /LENGTH=94 /DNA_ID=CAMNT_0049681083 /DNA_START=38 /DNA_END=322 /DNA_ORIENTATION=+